VLQFVPSAENRICDTPETASEALRARVTEVLVTQDAPPSMTTVPLGAARSRVIVSLAELDAFPAASRNCAYTLFVPSESASVYVFDVAYVSHVDHVEPSEENRICATPEVASVAESVRMTEVLVVHAVPPSIAIVPLGPARSKPMESFAELEALPAASRNCAYTVFVPSESASVRDFDVAYVSHPDHVVPSAENRMDATPEAASVAASVRVTEVLEAQDSPPSMTTVPLGAARSRVIVSLALLEAFPAPSRN
jgi:hypothetical protein